MKKRVFSILSLVLAAAILFSGYVLSKEQQQLADKMIRLHVVANSDSQEDQDCKLRVRDAVLAETEAILEDSQDPIQALSANLQRIEAAANECLQQQGSTHTANVTLQRELFPTRQYETFALPAGTYTSLRVTIGAGSGHNWWCVVFPSLCMSASMDEMEQAAQAAGLSEGEIKLITEESEGYQLKFKSLELLQELKNFLFD